ncbi:MAG: hypothetical protein K8W52_34130 [Deltaproteobacteria bacterium]|nr:hypothetical protein [Deltaproteobacteria bacterium]
MTLGVKFPDGLGDEPVPSLAPPQVSVAPSPWDPQPTVSPWVEPEPQVSVQPGPLDRLPEPEPLPQSQMPPPSLRVDLTGIDDTAPTIGPAPAPDTNPFDWLAH